MKLFELIAPDAPVGGLVISDTSIRIACITRKGRTEKLIHEEEPLPPDTVDEGIVINHGALVAALKRALAKAHGVSYFIVSIPPDSVYTKTLSFPISVSGERLKEAVDLSLGFQLPFPSENAYADYHVLPTEETNRVLLAASPQEVITAYEKALHGAGVRTVAIEPHTMSIARCHAGDVALILLPYAKGVVAAILEHGFVGFSRVIPLDRFVSDETQEQEIERIRDFYTVEHGVAPTIVTETDIALPKEFQGLIPEGTIPTGWAVAFGALLRARMPRSSDTFASLLPVGTEDAYAFQKATAFSALLRDATIGIVFFLVAAYAGVFSLISVLRNQNAETLSIRTVSPAGASLVAQEEEARAFNILLETTSTLARTSPAWSIFLDRFRALIPEGIILTNITIEAPNRPIQIAGVAKTRASLTMFKQTLSAQEDLSEVTLPLTNLELRSDIPFTMTFMVAESSLTPTYAK